MFLVYIAHKKAYAAWSTDKEIHKNSASGGIATELYNYAVDKKMYFAGVSMDKNLEAHFELVNNKNSIEKFQNSKYTFSYMDDIYLKCKELLKKDEKIFICWSAMSNCCFKKLYW